MKQPVVVLGAAALSLVLLQSALAQTAGQTVTLAVSAIYKISVSGNNVRLTIADGIAGQDALTSVSDNLTTYSMTQNVGNAKITAHLNRALRSGYTLQLTMASTKGSSAGPVDVSNATSRSAVDIVTAINRGADANQGITYTFSALASAGTLASTQRTVTLTLIGESRRRRWH